MVFGTTSGIQPHNMISTGGSVYGWIQHLHPSAVSGEKTIAQIEHDKDCNRNNIPADKLPHREHTEKVHRKKFDMEHLFEVVVMYLFNGLKATGKPSSGSMQNQGVQNETVTDTKALLHYLLYMIPEADKLKVLDLGHNADIQARTTHFERMKNVRVIFDHTDYKFRVIVKKTGLESGWIDICLELRMKFIKMINDILPKADVEIEHKWVDIVKQFKPLLLDSLSLYTKYDRDSVANWVLQDTEIEWETTTYAADDVREMDVTMNTNTHEVPNRPPFVVSYWADNYLEFDNYKLARMFNGLVGYGEFLYKRDNNYSRMAVNNFFIEDGHNKIWLWADLPRDAGFDRLTDIHREEQNLIATERQRGMVFEAVIERGTVFVTADFKRMVHRRQQEAWVLTQVPCIGETCELIAPTPLSFVDFYWLFAEIMQFMAIEIENLFSKRTGDVGNLINTMHVSKGLLPPKILEELYNRYIEFCFHVAVRRNNVDNDFHINRKIPPALVKNINRMLKFGIHIEREKWLMSEHTKVLPIDMFNDIQNSYTDNFWDSFNSSDPYSETSIDEHNSTRKKTHLTSPMMEKTETNVSNNSSHKTTYMDPAIDTHKLGYVKWAHFNKVPCTPFAVGYSADVVQKYYDRKVNYVDKDNYLATCDMTSMLRMTQTLMRGFDKFIIAVSTAHEFNPTKGNNRSRIRPIIQTTRSPYQNHGFAYPLDGSSGVYGRVADPHAGRREITSDDLLVFGNVLFTVVNNPGIFNLLNSASGDSMNVAKQQKQGELLVNSSEPVHYIPMTANIGFVNSGQEIMDGNDISTETPRSWTGISKMTHTKLRVGIMDQAALHHSSRWYVDEVLNNTRPTTSRTAPHAWSSFMYNIYQKQGFASLFRGHQARMQKCREKYRNFQKDYPVKDTDKMSIQEIIEEDAEVMVNNLHMCCEDAGLQVTDPKEREFAFASLRAQNIDIPKKTSHQLFYILFGETICRLADDLAKTEPLVHNIPQTLQKRSNDMMAHHLRVQIPRFLKHITDMFFSGDLHKNLVWQLQRNKHHSIPNKILRHGPWDFEKISENIMQATFKLKNIQGNPIKNQRWNMRSVSAASTRKKIVDMLRDDQMLSQSDNGNDSVISLGVVDPFDWNDESDEASYYKFTPNEGSLDEAEQRSKHKDLPGKPPHPETIDPEEYRLRAVFDPYIQMYKRIEIYSYNGRRYSESATHMQIINSKDMFYENRMLTIRLCEEQMHLIQRHQDLRKDYHQSLAWEFMFDMFLYQRQLLAELTLPPE